MIEADAVLIATGGLSYPSTGSTGDGYRFAKKVGHKVTKLLPSLVPFQISEEYIPLTIDFKIKFSLDTVWRQRLWA